MADTQIVRQYQTQHLNPQGKLEQVIVIDFNVGDDGPFSVTIPIAEFTADVARAAVQKLALEISSVQNY